MIDVTNYISKLERLKEYMDFYIEELASKEWSIYRIIYEEPPIPFPKNLACVKYDADMEVTTVRWNEHPRQGWGTRKTNQLTMLTPNLELWKIRVDKPIKSFEKWNMKYSLNVAIPKRHILKTKTTGAKN